MAGKILGAGGLRDESDTMCGEQDMMRGESDRMRGHSDAMRGEPAGARDDSDIARAVAEMRRERGELARGGPAVRRGATGMRRGAANMKRNGMVIARGDAEIAGVDPDILRDEVESVLKLEETGEAWIGSQMLPAEIGGRGTTGTGSRADVAGTFLHGAPRGRPRLLPVDEGGGEGKGFSVGRSARGVGGHASR